MTQLTYREATAADVEALLELWAVAAEDAHRPADDAAAVLRLLDRDPRALLLACDGDRLVGSVIGGWDGWRFHLYRLAVLPAYRRLGIAQHLLAQVEQSFAAHGATRIDAMVLRDNRLAHGFWAATGYSEQEEWRRWVKHPAVH